MKSFKNYLIEGLTLLIFGCASYSQENYLQKPVQTNFPKKQEELVPINFDTVPEMPLEIFIANLDGKHNSSKKDGVVDYDEFLTDFLLDVKKKNPDVKLNREKIDLTRAVFDFYDINRDGMISREDDLDNDGMIGRGDKYLFGR